jgi:hypothetical protein
VHVVKACINLEMDLRDFLHVAYRQVVATSRKFETLRNFELSESGNRNEKVWFVKVCSNLEMDLRDFLHVAYRQVVATSRKFETLRIKSLECRGFLLGFY